MGGINYTQGLQGIDPSFIRKQEMHDPFSHNTGFDSVLSKITTGLNLMGPAIGGGLNFLGGQGSAITSAALMGFAGQGGVSTPGLGGATPMAGGAPGGPKFSSWGAAPGTTNPKLLGGGIPLGDAPGYPGAGGGMPGAAPGFGGSGVSTAGFGGMPGTGGVQDVTQFDSQINSMMNNNLMFLALQTKVQNVAQMTQMTSNIAKADSDAKLNAIRNMRS